MFLRQLELLHFKNYPEAVFQFSEGINCITGPNGSGKTNVLDAIHYLSLCKSYFTATDTQNLMRGESMMMIKGVFEKGGNSDEVICHFKTGQKKQMRLNGKEYSRLADHIGLFPVVMIAPTDHELITGGSDERRRFIDRILSQVNRQYLEQLNQYLRTLEQRNALLRSTAAGKIDFETLEVYNEQLSSLSEAIFKERRNFCSEFERHFIRFYDLITSGAEESGFRYESQLHENTPFEWLRISFQKDCALQFTTTGVHKDDLSFTVNGMNVRRYGSQGQQKSVLIALKLAHFNYLFEQKGIKPIMMFDDLFDRLDDARVEQIICLMQQHNFGQMFITHTAEDRLDSILNHAGIEHSFFRIRNGSALIRK
jgi:DNA replication and repair protein RecF